MLQLDIMWVKSYYLVCICRYHIEWSKTVSWREDFASLGRGIISWRMYPSTGADTKNKSWRNDREVLKPDEYDIPFSYQLYQV